MGFYGYNPAQFVQKDKFGIGAISQIMGGAVAKLPEVQAQEKKTEAETAKMTAAAEKWHAEKTAAIQAAKDNWKDMEAAATTFRNQYIEKATIAVQNGLMTEEEKAAGIKEFPMPTSIDRKDPGAYIDKLTESYGGLLGDLEKRTSTSQLGKAVSAAQRGGGVGVGPEQQVSGGQLGGGFTEQEIDVGQGIQPPAETQQEIAQSPQVEEGIEAGKFTTKQLQQDPRFATAQTPQQVATQQRQKEQDLVTANNRAFDDRIKRDAQRRLQVAANFKKTQALNKEEKADLKYKIDYYDDQIEGLTQSLNMNKNMDEPNLKIIDGIKLRITTAQREKDENFKLLNDAIKKGKDQASGGGSQEVTIEDIHAKFGPLEPGEGTPEKPTLEGIIRRSLKTANPETGELYTLDEIYDFVKKKFPHMLPQQTAQGYTPPKPLGFAPPDSGSSPTSMHQ